MASNACLFLLAVALVSATAQNAGRSTEKMAYSVIENASAPRLSSPQYRLLQQGKSTIVTIFAGRRPTAGYSIPVNSVERTVSKCTVQYKVEEPGPDVMVVQEITYPSLTLRLPLTCEVVRLEPPLRRGG